MPPMCERFDSSQLPRYKEMQKQCHPSVPQPTIPFSGFSSLEALVMLAEDHTGGRLADSGVVFIRIPSKWEKKPSTATQIWLFVFPRDSLFQPEHPMPKPYRLEGTPEATSRNPGRLNAASTEYVIDDIKHPCVQPLVKVPELLEGEEWAVIPFTKDDQRELLPLFHAGTKLNPKVAVDDFEEDFTDDLFPSADYELDPKGLRNVVAKAVLQVPFRFAYPRTAKSSLEQYQRQQSKRGDTISYIVELKEIKKGISVYVCSVKFQSDPDLTEAIHRIGE
jgi:hypothetical protein